MLQEQLSRRCLLKKSMLAAVVGSAVPFGTCTKKALAAVSANDRLRIGCIGLGHMATAFDAPQHATFGDVRAVCDVDLNHAHRAKNDPQIGKGKADVYRDYRKVLERNDIDVVSIVTVDHWHVKIAIEALQAGKHVFCQKPLTLTLEEGQLIRKACQKYNNRVFIVGTQQRSHIGRFLRAVNMVQKGLLGDIRKVVIGINGGDVGGPFPKATPPKELDWDLWLGQTPKADYIQNRCHYNFRWWYAYSGGKFTDWGAHHVDIATWAIGQDKEGMGPIEIDGTDAKHPVPFKDGYPTVDNCYNTAVDFAVKCRFANGIEMIVNSRSDNGVLFEGTKGRIFVNREKIVGRPVEERWDEGQFGLDDVRRLHKGKEVAIDAQNFYQDTCEGRIARTSSIDSMPAHKANFYQCIREGGVPISDVVSHVQAMNTCHLCAIAVRLGRVIRWDPKTENILDDDQAAAFFSRKPRRGFEIPRVY
jgi:predicted dehydrogenase